MTITKSVFEEMLTALSQPTCEERESDITPEMLKAKAANMVRRGYRFNSASLEALRLYMAGYGLFIHGSVGTGKTMFFRSLRTFEGGKITIFSMHNILGRSDSDIREMMDDLVGSEVLLDDIGAEPLFNNFGVKFDMLAYLIERRMESPERTHFTTNLKKGEIKDRYGIRIIDRITEMCKSVEFSGASNRVAKTNPKAVNKMASYIAAQGARRAAQRREGVSPNTTDPPDRKSAPSAFISPSLTTPTTTTIFHNPTP